MDQERSGSPLCTQLLVNETQLVINLYKSGILIVI